MAFAAVSVSSGPSLTSQICKDVCVRDPLTVKHLEEELSFGWAAKHHKEVYREFQNMSLLLMTRTGDTKRLISYVRVIRLLE
jgi:hypothetical protein